MRGLGITLVTNDTHHSLDIAQDFIVPETKNSKPLHVKPGGAFIVIFIIFSMLTTIRLNNQPSLKTDKIDYEESNLFLTAEFIPTYLLTPEMFPEKPLGVRCRLSQGPGTISKIR